MKPLTVSITAAVGSIVITAGILAYLQQQRSTEAYRLRVANQRVKFEANQRRQVLTERLAPKRSSDTASESTGTPSGSPETEPDGYRNEGMGTPHATLQTFAWAADSGDVAAVAKLMMFEGGGRDKAIAFMARLPADMRSQWPSPEEMAASIFISQALQNPFPYARILANAPLEPIGEDRVVLRLPGLKDRGIYQRTRDGWKFVITEQAVDDALAQLTGQPR